MTEQEHQERQDLLQFESAVKNVNRFAHALTQRGMRIEMNLMDRQMIQNRDPVPVLDARVFREVKS